jgi:hypothetical protein
VESGWGPDPQINGAVVRSGACANSSAEGVGSGQWLKGNTVVETNKGEWRAGKRPAKACRPSLRAATEVTCLAASRAAKAC